MALATAAAFMATPPTRTFIEGVGSHELWSSLQRQLLPKDRWFRVLGDMGRLAEADGLPGRTGRSAPPHAAPASIGVVPAATDLTTGAIRPAGDRRP
jgi:hypothetical protein